MKKKYLSLKDVQYEQKEMLKVIINYLDSNNIDYFVSDGTFLGAVRHKGFIPWDDDIDISLLRPYYEKLIYLLKNDNNINGLKGISFELGNDNWPFLKIINNSISLSSPSFQDKKLWIDVFPIDGCPTKKYLYSKFGLLYRRLYVIKRSDATGFYSEKGKMKRVTKKLIAFLLKPISFDKYTNFYIKYCSKYSVDDSDYVSNNVWGKFKKDAFEKEYCKFDYYDFEDLKVKGIKNYDLYLSKKYGDYMKIPPIEQRVSHSFKAWKNE